MDFKEMVKHIKEGNDRVFLDEEFLPNLEYIGEDLNTKHRPKYCGTHQGKAWFSLKLGKRIVYIHIC